MAADEYDKVELPALQQLQSLGWGYLHGDQLTPQSLERNSFRDPVLEGRLTTAIQRINPWINEENLRKVVRNLTQHRVESLMEVNQSIWETLTQYISEKQDDGHGLRSQTVKIIDFDNPDINDFLCVNQFKVEGVHQNIYPDIVLFVNGLPLVVIECKSPYIANPMSAGIDQLLRYANRRQPHEDEGAERLFHYNQMMVSTHRESAKVATISAKMEHYLEWKDAYPLSETDLGEAPTSQELLIAGLFNKHNLLDLIQNFTVFEPVDGRTIKKLARYQQFRAVHKTIERLRTGTTRKERGGVIWHTQGSGKSLTMVFLAMKMRRDEELREYKLVFLTDRTQLDTQLTTTFRVAQNETVYHAKSVAHLKELLAKDSSDLVTAMVQKFQENADDFDFQLLNASDKIVVLADEAHRTQYGTLGAAINTALPNAPKIAFTGTPLIKSRKTNNEFGTYIDTYTIEQAVRDEATVQILYEGREARTKVTGDSLDHLFDAYFGDRTDEEREAIKRKYGTEKAVLEAPQRIRWICIDIIKHYREHIQPNGFKAMIVTNSRHAAVTYKEMLDELEGPESAVIISGDHNDPPHIARYTDAKEQKEAIDKFKKPLAEYGLSVLVVKDMLLTGFDAPVCQVMYLDRKLTDHTLLQAIARVNRTRDGKFRGYIVDYYGLSDYLTEALEMFSTDDVAGALNDLKEEIPRLKACHTRVMEHFKGLDKDDMDACILSLEDEAHRQQFEIDFRKFSKQLDIVLPDPAANPFLADLKFLGKVAHGARNMFRDEQLNITGVGAKVRKLIDEHIYATGVDPKIPPIPLLAQDFESHVAAHTSPRAKASDIEHAIRHHINVNVEEDPEYYKKLSERLKQIIQEYEDRWDEMSQMLLAFRDDIEEGRKRGAAEVGLTETKYAFYNILSAEVGRAHELQELDNPQHQEIIAVTGRLVDMMEQATSIVDFFQKQDEVKSVKRRIKRTLVDTSFDSPELRQKVIDQFMELARVKFE